MRLDALVAARTGASRARAQALILEGRVHVDGAAGLKAGQLVAESADVLISDAFAYVSRGALKLEKALAEFSWSPAGARCLDVGASTGGFTDCLLARGAEHVTAVDVGYGQLAWRLRQDPRVRVVERCNFRHAALESIGAPFAFATADVSFISLTKLAAKFADALDAGAKLIVLVKPQFEAGRAAVGRGGVVREPRAQAATIQSVIEAYEASGFTATRLTYAPHKGPAGNIEFLLGLERANFDAARPPVAPTSSFARAQHVTDVVRAAHEGLDR